MRELVVLVDDNNKEIGTSPKDTVHTQNTPLHRGFSLFLFNSKGQLLLTRRALTKKTFPGVWTNTVCGHPAPHEDPVTAAKRRLKDELGIEEKDLKDIKIVSPYRYRFADTKGIVENEICPVLVAHSDVEPQANNKEVEEAKWINWDKFREEIKNNPQNYSPWSGEEASLIAPLI